MNFYNCKIGRIVRISRDHRCLDGWLRCFYLLVWLLLFKQMLYLLYNNRIFLSPEVFLALKMCQISFAAEAQPGPRWGNSRRFPRFLSGLERAPLPISIPRRRSRASQPFRLTILGTPLGCRLTVYSFILSFKSNLSGALHVISLSLSTNSDQVRVKVSQIQLRSLCW